MLKRAESLKNVIYSFCIDYRFFLFFFLFIIDYFNATLMSFLGSFDFHCLCSAEEKKKKKFFLIDRSIEFSILGEIRTFRFREVVVFKIYLKHLIYMANSL